MRIVELFDPTLSAASPEFLKEGDRKRMRGKSCGVGEESDVSMVSCGNMFFFRSRFFPFRVRADSPLPIDGQSFWIRWPGIGFRFERVLCMCICFCNELELGRVLLQCGIDM